MVLVPVYDWIGSLTLTVSSVNSGTAELTAGLRVLKRHSGTVHSSVFAQRIMDVLPPVTDSVVSRVTELSLRSAQLNSE